jgi:hypothetical protein
MDTNSIETTTTMEIAGRAWDVKVSDRRSAYGKRRWNSKKGWYVESVTRIFVSTPDEYDDIFHSVLGAPCPTPEMFPALALESALTHRGEYPEVDKAWNKHNRAYVKGQSAVLSAITEIIEVDEFRYDRHAGCSCPCSPGFIAKSGKNYRGTTIFINVKPAS